MIAVSNDQKWAQNSYSSGLEESKSARSGKGVRYRPKAKAADETNDRDKTETNPRGSIEAESNEIVAPLLKDTNDSEEAVLDEMKSKIAELEDKILRHSEVIIDSQKAMNQMESKIAALEDNVFGEKEAKRKEYWFVFWLTLPFIVFYLCGVVVFTIFPPNKSF